LKSSERGTKSDGNEKGTKRIIRGSISNREKKGKAIRRDGPGSKKKKQKVGAKIFEKGDSPSTII